MKITIKKVSLLVVALAAVYFVMPMKALNKKELKAREEAVQNFLKRSNLSEKDAAEFENLVSKLQGTMLAHKVQKYRSDFKLQTETALAVAELDKLANANTDPVEKRVAIESLRSVIDKLKESNKNLNETLESTYNMGQFIVAMFLDAMFKRANLNTPDSDKLYRKPFIQYIKEGDELLADYNGDLYAPDESSEYRYLSGAKDKSLEEVVNFVEKK